MFKGEGEEREGALLRRLKDAGRGGKTGSFGFVTGAEGGARGRPLAVIARLASGASAVTQAQSLAEAGVDGIEIALRDATDLDAFARIAGAVNVPCGLYVGGGRVATATAGAVEGIDWLHVALDAPARLLTEKGPTRIVSLAPDMPPGRVAGLAGLKADIVVVDGPGAGTLTVDTLLALRVIQGTSKGPVLAGSGLGIVPDDAAVLHEHGVEGILIAGDVSSVRDMIEAIEKLGASRQ